MLRAENVSKYFGKEAALTDVNCTFSTGSICGMIGSNGAGKSTLLRTIAGVYSADRGAAVLDQRPVWENPAVKAQIFYLSDETYMLPEAGLERMAQLYAAYCPRFDRARFEELVALFKLDRKKKLAGFSKGMRRQAAIVLALAARPRYLLLDETFDGLDPVVRRLVRQLICADVAERETGVLLASHSLREMEDLCDRLIFLHNGRVLLEKDTDQLKTELLKVQAAFEGEYDETAFTGFEVLKYTRSGQVANVIMRGDREHVMTQLKKKVPLLLEIVPLSLEEVFTYELETLGYRFDVTPAEDTPFTAEQDRTEERKGGMKK